MLPCRLEMRPDPSSGAEAVCPGRGRKALIGVCVCGGGGVVSSPQPGICPGSQPREAIPDSRQGRGLPGESPKRGETEARVTAL